MSVCVTSALHGIVFEIVLYQYEWRAFVAAAACQVAQTCKQVRKLTRCGALAQDICRKVVLLVGDEFLHLCYGFVAAKVGKVVVGNLLQFDFVGFAVEPGSKLR